MNGGRTRLAMVFVALGIILLAVAAIETRTTAPHGFNPVLLTAVTNGTYGPYDLPIGKYRFEWTCMPGGSVMVWVDDGITKTLVVNATQPNGLTGSANYKSIGAHTYLEVGESPPPSRCNLRIVAG